MYDFLMDFIFCISGIQVGSLNVPHGENIEDAQISRSLQAWLESNGYNPDFIYLYNRVTVDINFEDQADNEINEDIPASPEVDPSPRVSDHSGTERVETSDIPISDNEFRNSPDENVGVSSEDCEVQLPRTPRRRRKIKKRNRKRAFQHMDSSSENEEHPCPLRKRRRQKSQDCVEEPVAGQPKSKKSKGLGSLFLTSSEEDIVPGPSRQSKRQKGNKRKDVTLNDKYPFDDTESSGDEFVPGRRRKSSRKEKKKEAKDEDNKK